MVFAAITLAVSLISSLWLANEVVKVVHKATVPELPDYPDAVAEGPLGVGGYLKPGFDELVHDGYGGSVRWTNNSQGFRHDLEFDRQPASGVLRVLSLGDSFTAGYRVDQSETFSKLIENWSGNAIGPTEVLISQIEEPAQGLKYLKKFGHAWSPHAVLLGVTLGNDIAQVYVSRHPTSLGFRKGLDGQGLARYDLPGYCFKQLGLLDRVVRPILWGLTRSTTSRVLFRTTEPIKSWYRRKEGLKLFDPINGLGMYIREPPEEINEAYQRLFRLLLEIKAFTAAHQIGFAVLIFPQRFQIQPRDWEVAVWAYQLDPDAFDLMAPNRRILAFCQQEDILCIDPTDAMRAAHRTTGQNYYLPRGDMHWNRDGHREWFRGARPALEEFLKGIAGYDEITGLADKATQSKE